MSDKESKLKADEALEAEVQKLGDYQIHPIVSRIQHRLGVLNIIRNARNRNQVDIEKVVNE